jgi:hypothetical protein
MFVKNCEVEELNNGGGILRYSFSVFDATKPIQSLSFIFCYLEKEKSMEISRSRTRNDT